MHIQIVHLQESLHYSYFLYTMHIDKGTIDYPLQCGEYLVSISSEGYGSLNAYFAHIWLLSLLIVQRHHN